jgi:CobQ-like glutamine amidotransferase family enzyme
MDKESYLTLVEENQQLKKTVGLLELQLKAARREMLQERVWRIRFQMDHLAAMLKQAEAELAEVEKANGNQAEDALPGQN